MYGRILFYNFDDMKKFFYFVFLGISIGVLVSLVLVVNFYTLSPVSEKEIAEDLFLHTVTDEQNKTLTEFLDSLEQKVDPLTLLEEDFTRETFL
jgi:hypothetical protein